MTDVPASDEQIEALKRLAEALVARVEQEKARADEALAKGRLNGLGEAARMMARADARIAKQDADYRRVVAAALPTANALDDLVKAIRALANKEPT